MPLPASTTAAANLVKVKSVDLHTRTNAERHHTDQFEVTQATTGGIAILRRGEVFTLTVELDGNFKPDTHSLWLQFFFGAGRLISQQYHIVLSREGDFTKGEESWDGRVLHSGKQLRLEVYIPYTALVGPYRLKVRTVLQGDTGVYDVYECKQPTWVLFNPWCKNDQVYLPDEQLLAEYVQNQDGELYAGTENNFRARPWSFAQFDYSVLEAVEKMLGSSFDHRARGDVVRYSRAIAHKVNSTTYGGILQGNWSGDYSGGTAPWKWTGSKKIVHEYLKTGGPVKFAQCWVFSALTVTMCRALGIPCRSVTNFQSAHDTNKSLTIDKFFDTRGQPIEFTGMRNDGSDDSIWNFHVWNDAWMTRKDLPKGFGGWQAIDATPQEASSGMYTCGPYPLHALRMGDVTLRHDGEFVFAEINADVVYWIVHDGEDPMPVKADTDRVGVLLLTKSPKSNGIGSNHEDITSQYKYAEGSEAERVSVLNAISSLNSPVHRDFYENNSPQDVEFTIDTSRSLIGEDVIISVKAHNKSDSARTIDLFTTVNTMLYTGVLYHQVRKHDFSHALKPRERASLEMRVSSADYSQHLAEDCNFVYFALIRVVETKQATIKRKVFSLGKPTLDITVKSKAPINTKLKVKFGFKNPLDRPISNLEFSIEGRGFNDISGIYKGKVGAHSVFEHEVAIDMRKPGPTDVIVTVNCNDIFDITGRRIIYVTK